MRKSAQADAKQAPAIVMMADANGQPKDLTVKAKPKSKAAPTSAKSSKAKPAAKATKSTKTTSRSRSKTAASKAPDLDAAADQLLANASGKAADTPQSAADAGTTTKEETNKCFGDPSWSAYTQYLDMHSSRDGLSGGMDRVQVASGGKRCET